MIKTIRNFIFQTYFRISRPMTLGVRIIVSKNNQFCLIKHTYIDGWHLPGGGVEKNESAYQAALKEIREEAGIIAKIEDLKLISIHTNFENFKGDHVILFEVNKFEETQKFNANEIKEMGFFTIDNLPDGTTRATIERLNEFIKIRTQSHKW